MRDHVAVGGREPRFYQAGSSEMFGAAQAAAERGHAVLSAQPLRRGKVCAHWSRVNYREAYGLFVCNGILFNHETPRRGETFVTRKITRAVGRIKLGLQEKLYPRQSRRQARLGLRRRLRRGDVADAAAGRARRLRHRHRRDAQRPRVRRAGLRRDAASLDWRRANTSRSIRAISARPKSTSSSAIRPRRAASSAGSRSMSFDGADRDMVATISIWRSREYAEAGGLRHARAARPPRQG